MNDSTTFFCLLCLVAGSTIFMAKRLLRYLHAFQLDEYNGSRLLSWIWSHRVFDTRGTAVALVAALLAYATTPIACLIAGVALASIGYAEPDPRRFAKVSLKMTDRAVRIYKAAMALTLVLQSLFLILLYDNIVALWIAQIVLFQTTPLLLITACTLLRRDEQQRQNTFQQEAQKILAEVHPYTIGITGSYGKTSTKDALGRILQITLGPTFWTQKSINTVMGITREVRNHLKKGMEFAVMEMGAYRPGSIDRLCQLTPPDAAIITCIGLAHLERFGSPDNIFQAKSELARNVPSDGILVCNGDDEGARSIANENPKKVTLLYGLHPERASLDVWVSDCTTTPQGTDFVVYWKGTAHKGFTPLLGKTALSNVVGAFTMACALGANPVFVLGAIRNLQPVDNRLEVKNEAGVTYLRDAYNSNPAGFKAALEVLAALPSQRKILMTPGMIELGSEQAAKNEELARHAGGICDIALVVGATNRVALETGAHSGGMDPRNIYWCASREDAFQLLKTLAREGDSVLIENDLTDLYVTPTKF